MSLRSPARGLGEREPDTHEPAEAAAGAPVIQVSELKTVVGRNQVLHEGLNLTVRRGEVMGLVGGSGSGKSVLLHTIIGLRSARAGRIEMLGYELGRATRDDMRQLRQRSGVLFQDGALFGGLTVAENIALPLRELTDLKPRLIQEIARMKVAMVGLAPDAADKLPSELSGGMRKRAGLARALALDPEILFLDEPTAGLDPIGAHGFDELIASLQHSLDLTVLMITHDLDTLHAICDRVAALIDRKCVVGTIPELMRLPHPWIAAYFDGPRGRAALRAEPAAAEAGQAAAESAVPAPALS